MSKKDKKNNSIKELTEKVSNLEKGIQNAVNTIGQTITDYVIFNDDYDKFMAFLKGKYQKEKTNEANKGKETSQEKGK